MKISVTQDHIDRGRFSCSHCPIALAIMETSDDDTTVVVNVSSVMVYISGEYHVEYDLPIEAVLFIKTFDNGDYVVPFTFELPIRS